MTRTVRKKIIPGFFLTSMIFIHTGCSCNQIESTEESKPPVESRPEVEKLETEKSESAAADAQNAASEIPGSGIDSKSNDAGDKPGSQSAENSDNKASIQGKGTQPNATGNQTGGIGSPGTSVSESGNSAGASVAGNSSGTIGGVGVSGVPDGGQSTATGSVAGKAGNPSQNGPSNETYTKAGRIRKK